MRTVQSLGLDLKDIFQREPWWAEFWSAIASITWAMISVVSGQDFDNSDAWFKLTFLAKQEFWEVLGVTIGLMQLASLMLSSRGGRWVSCFFASWWFLFLALVVSLQTEFFPPSLGLYLVFGSINLFSLVRLARRYA